MPPRVLITGASGLLGRHLSMLALERFEVFAANHHLLPLHGIPVALHLLDFEGTISAITSLKPAIIIHAAALQRGSRSSLLKTNVEGSSAVELAAKSCNARLIYISTEAVYCGKRPPYTEDMPALPVSDYGASKLAGEPTIEGSCSVRLALLRETPIPPTPYTNEYRTPICLDCASRHILALATRPEATGTYNLGGERRLSRFELAKERFPGVHIEGAKSHDASRPRDTSLDSGKLKALLKVEHLCAE